MSTAGTPTRRWVASDRDPSWSCPDPDEAAQRFHRALADYAPTPLVELPELARELGVGTVVAKDESTRLGLPAFKALGASWAVHRALETAGRRADAEVITATDGNHGRAVAHFARAAGRRARILVPAGGVHPSAIAAIRAEGAEVVEVDGSYDRTVRAAADHAAEHDGVLVQDTAWDGYEEVPRWIVEGYATLFSEIEAQLHETGRNSPDLLLVPTGVGSLLQAALAHHRRRSSSGSTAVVSVEPDAAACIGPSLEVGHPVTVETGTTIMSGLNCGTPSSLAWPLIRDGLDAAVTVSDQGAIDAAHRLAALGVQAGPCGAASLAGAREILTVREGQARRQHLGLGPDSVVVLMITEGAEANPVPAA
ncbi:diaminopropionate ammonia-lyase [Brachybacterium vulturis]|uniref:diaminopropionate ammonia-lyase n=1 Tax=Brachybacterium vulturis TaxID=2017484 RepID=UPI0037365C0B